MSHYVNLEMSYTTYLRLYEAVEEATMHAKDFDETQERVHLVEYLEDEYQRDSAKQNREFQNWLAHEELFKNKKCYHDEYFYDVESVFEDYIDKKMLKWDISEKDKFHLICELIDVFKKEESE